MRVITFFFCLAVISSANASLFDDVQRPIERENVSQGKRAVQQLHKFIRSKDFEKVLDLIGLFGGPIAGSVTSILKMLIKSGGSNDDADFAREAFAEINNKLESFTNEFKEVKSLIDWNAIQVSYGTYERSVRALKVQLQLLVEAPAASVPNLRHLFILKYESDFQNAAEKIYDGIVNSDLIFSRNLLEASAKFSENHRVKVQMFGMGLTQLLIQAVEIQMAYFDLKYENQDTTDYMKSVWSNRMAALKAKMKSFDQLVITRWVSQMPQDAARLVQENRELPTNELALKLFYFMDEKFYWRAFVSVVYDDISGSQSHDMSYCRAFSSFNKYGKNVVVSSVDKELSQFNQTKVAEIREALNEATLKDADHLLEIINEADDDSSYNCKNFQLKLVALDSANIKVASSTKYSSYIKKCVSSFWGTTCFGVVLFG